MPDIMKAGGEGWDKDQDESEVKVMLRGDLSCCRKFGMQLARSGAQIMLSNHPTYCFRDTHSLRREI
jgi:hypothetical protein